MRRLVLVSNFIVCACLWMGFWCPAMCQVDNASVADETETDTMASPSELVEAEGMARRLLHACIDDAGHQQYLITLSDRFLDSLARVERLSGATIAMIKYESRVPAELDRNNCPSESAIVTIFEEREPVVSASLGTPSPNRPTSLPTTLIPVP